MQTNAFYDAATHSVVTPLPDGRLVRVSFGDFLSSQKRLAHSLRGAAIDAAIDAAWQRLRRLGRSTRARLFKLGPALPH